MIRTFSDLTLAVKLADCIFETDLTEEPCRLVQERESEEPCGDPTDSDCCPPCKSRLLIAELNRRTTPCRVCDDTRMVVKRVNGEMVTQICPACT